MMFIGALHSMGLIAGRNVPQLSLRREAASIRMEADYSLYYWTGCTKFYHRAAPLVTILEHAGVSYEIKDHNETPPPEGFPAFAAPMVVGPGGVVVGQTMAAAATLGKAFDMCPSEPSDEALALNIAMNSADLFSEFGTGDSKPADRVDAWLKTYETALSRAGNGFLVGESLSYADLASFPILDKIASTPGASSDVATTFPKLAAWLEMMQSTAGAKGLKASGVPFLMRDAK